MDFKHAFKPYIEHPETGGDAVLFFDDKAVILKDKFSKSFRHYLIIPRDLKVTYQHPLDVFQNNQQLYDGVKSYVSQVKELIVDEFIKFGLVGFDKYDKLNYHTFKNTFIKAGVHSIPSLSNLHIHVISSDFNLDKMKNKKHYNSFTTKFFVDFEDLSPVMESNHHQVGFLDHQSGSESGSNDSYDESDNEQNNEAKILSMQKFERDEKVLMNIIKTSPLTCTYCGRKFGNRFKELKAHLGDEFGKKFSIGPCI